MDRRVSLTVLVIVLAAAIALVFLFQGNKETDQCMYSSKNYTSTSLEECSRIRYTCAEEMKPFQNDCGCGCEPASTEKYYCTSESRDNELCIQEYAPVCGWFDPKQIQCIKYPCAQTFTNSCFSCIDPRVLYWTEGECPA
ncbi:hypothetical protein KW787_01040 [Candidatus Pacearchaeota archaeon]|nr:hypothetical protein [Candidatus Pacearchaeota archaeon]